MLSINVTGSDMCPKPWHHYHSEYLNADRGANAAVSEGRYSYQLELTGEDVSSYLSGQTHACQSNIIHTICPYRPSISHTLNLCHEFTINIMKSLYVFVSSEFTREWKQPSH